RSDRGDGANVARLRTFWSLLDLILDPRTLSEALVPLAADRAVMDEHVLAAVVLGDEAVALVGAEPLHGSGCHISTSPTCITNVQRKAQSRNRYSLELTYSQQPNPRAE